MEAASQRPGGRRPAGERLRPEHDELPVRECFELANHGSEESALRGTPFEDDRLALRGRGEEIEIDPRRDDAIAARKAESRRRRGLLARREQRVHACEQAQPLGAAGRVGEPFGRVEGRHGERLGVAQRQVGETRQSGLEAVHDVEPAGGEREREVGAGSHRNPHPAAARDG